MHNTLPYTTISDGHVAGYSELKRSQIAEESFWNWNRLRQVLNRPEALNHKLIRFPKKSDELMEPLAQTCPRNRELGHPDKTSSLSAQVSQNREPELNDKPGLRFHRTEKKLLAAYIHILSPLCSWIMLKIDIAMLVLISILCLVWCFIVLLHFR